MNYLFSILLVITNVSFTQAHAAIGCIPGQCGSHGGGGREQYILKRKMNIVELASQLGNISEACRNLRVSRQHFYDIKTAIQEDGLEGLLEKSRRAPRTANRLSPELEQRILDYSLEFPTHGQRRASNELKILGINVSDGGVRGTIFCEKRVGFSASRSTQLKAERS